MNWFSLKRRSLFLSAGFILSALVALYTYKQLEMTTGEFFARYTLHRERAVLAYLDVSQHVFQAKGIDGLKPILDGAVENRIFDWYLIRHNNHPVFVKPEGIEKISDLQFEPNKPQITMRKSYQTVELIDGLTVTIGVNKNRYEYMKAIWEDQYKTIIQDAIVPVILALLVFMFFLKDILKLLGVIKTGSVAERLKSLEDISVRSQEALILKNSLRGYEVTLGKMEHERRLLSGQVLPSIRREILQNRKPPYEFNCTLVRMDINQFSNMFNQCDRDILLNQIHQYFERVTVIVSGYGGYVHEFVGDEVLFYFKDEEVKDSRNMALATVRDIFEMTSHFSDQFQKATKFPLIVKAACCHGTLRFGKLVDGFNLAGGILIETVRVLSQVHDKLENICVFSSLDPESVSPVAQMSKYGDYQLKGYSETISVWKVDQFHPHRHPQYWKSNKSLAYWLKQFEKEMSVDPSRALSVLNEIYQSPTYEIHSDSIQLLTKQIQTFSGMKNEFEQSALETLTSLLRVLPDNEELKQFLKDHVGQLLSTSSERVRANIIEVGAGILNAESLRKVMFHPSPRIRANALVLLARQQLSKEVIDQFHSLIHSIDPGYVASGLYALHETIVWYLEHNRVALEANVDMKQIYQYGISLRKSENISIARQARELGKVDFVRQKLAS